MHFISCIIFFCYTITLCYCFLQEFVFYMGEDFTGDRISIRSTKTNLLAHYPQFVNHTSFCQTGWWRFYERPNFKGLSNKGINKLEEPRYCFNGPYPDKLTGSLTYQGPLNTETKAISFFSKADYTGGEILIKKSAHGFLSFQPKSMITFGHTNWTLFSGNNFDGDAHCLISPAEIAYSDSSKLGNLKIDSVKRGSQYSQYKSKIMGDNDVSSLDCSNTV